MSIELIPVVIFAWFVELAKLVESNAGILFFSPLLAIVWVSGIIFTMRRWDGR